MLNILKKYFGFKMKKKNFDLKTFFYAIIKKKTKNMSKKDYIYSNTYDFYFYCI